MNLLKWLNPLLLVELCTLWGGGKGSAPPAPDYTGAAEAQSAASKEIATQQTWANRPTQNTPWGSTYWSAAAGTDPATGQPITQWTQTQTLDPALRSALDDQLAIQAGKSDLAGSFMNRVASEYSQPFNWQNLPGMAQTPNAQMTYGRNLQTGYGDSQRLAAGYIGNTTSAQGGPGLSPTGQDVSAPWQTTQTTNEPAFAAQRQQLMEANLNRMAPVHQRQEDAVRTMLANQGLTPGSEAYNQELSRLSQQQAGERWNALEQSGQEQARMQQMLLGQQQQAFGQDVTSQNTQNQALMNLFQQQQAAGQMGLSREQQAFMQSIGGQQAYNQALAQQQGLDAARAQFYNQAQNQLFGQDQAANAQNWQQMMQQAEYQNRLRQQAIAEQAMARGMSLNEMNALLTGQQVNTPQMPGFMGASAGQAPNYLGAAQAQYGAAQDAFNAEQQGQQGMMSGLFGLGSAAMMMF